MRERAKNNIYINSIRLCIRLIYGLYRSCLTLLGGKGDISKKEFEFLDFLLEGGPKSFWKQPTGIRLGRALFAPILFLFFRDHSPKNIHETTK